MIYDRIKEHQSDNRRLQEIDNTFHHRFGGESDIEDWSLVNLEENTRHVRMKFVRQLWQMKEEENKTDRFICNKIIRELEWGVVDKYTKAWIWSTKL